MLKDVHEPLSFSDMEERCLEGSWRYGIDENPEVAKMERSSQSAFVRRRLLHLAHLQCEGKNIEPDSGKSWQIYDAAGELANELTWPSLIFDGSFLSDGKKVRVDDVRQAYRLTSDVEPSQLINQAHEGKDLRIDLEGFQYAVGSYLESEFRDKKIDRILLKTLIDTEVTAYLKHVFWWNPVANSSLAHDYQKTKSPVLEWLYNRIQNGLFALLVIGISIATLLLLNSEKTVYVIMLSIGVLLLWITDAVIGLIKLPQKVNYFTNYTKTSKVSFEEIPKALIAVYSELWSTGPLSVPRIKELLLQADKAEISWPSSVWVLMDDLEARSVSSL